MPASPARTRSRPHIPRSRPPGRTPSHGRSAHAEGGARAGAQPTPAGPGAAAQTTPPEPCSWGRGAHEVLLGAEWAVRRSGEDGCPAPAQQRRWWGRARPHMGPEPSPAAHRQRRGSPMTSRSRGNPRPKTRALEVTERQLGARVKVPLPGRARSWTLRRREVSGSDIERAGPKAHGLQRNAGRRGGRQGCRQGARWAPHTETEKKALGAALPPPAVPGQRRPRGLSPTMTHPCPACTPARPGRSPAWPPSPKTPPPPWAPHVTHCTSQRKWLP